MKKRDKKQEEVSENFVPETYSPFEGFRLAFNAMPDPEPEGFVVHLRWKPEIASLSGFAKEEVIEAEKVYTGYGEVRITLEDGSYRSIPTANLVDHFVEVVWG